MRGIKPLYIIIALTLFIVAMLLALLSYTPSVQSNLKWMTNFYFYIVVGTLLGCALLLAAYVVAKQMILIN
jgi:hypothetical protein